MGKAAAHCSQNRQMVFAMGGLVRARREAWEMKRKSKKIDNAPGGFSLVKLYPRLWVLELPEPWEISEDGNGLVTTAIDNDGKELKCLFIPIEEAGRGEEKK